MDLFKRFYPALLEILPVDDLLTQFYSKNLLSGAHKDKLDGLSTAKATNKDRAKYFLDNVIQPGLKIGFMKLFDEMVMIMAKNDDPCVNFLASEITKTRESSDITSHSTTTAANGGKSRDSHPQGKYNCTCVVFLCCKVMRRWNKMLYSLLVVNFIRGASTNQLRYSRTLII